jgi:putative SOS response-associated peptidase YedK
LIPTDGFYEWKKVGKQKMPQHIRRRDEAPFAFAGLWEIWRSPDGEPLETCTILTISANEVVAPLDDRMPVILPREHFDEWLKPGDADAAGFMPLMVPYPATELVAVPANPICNNPKYDGPDCLLPAPNDEVNDANGEVQVEQTPAKAAKPQPRGRPKKGT